MKYKIKYNYDSGDSFSQYPNNEDCIELEFENLEVAKANLKRIKEHYLQYEEVNSYSIRIARSAQEIFKANKNKDWFVKKEKPCVWTSKTDFYAIDEDRIEACKEAGKNVGVFLDDYYAAHCIILYADNGNPFQISCNWCGYFEKLNHVEIVPDNSGMKISF